MRTKRAKPRLDQVNLLDVAPVRRAGWEEVDDLVVVVLMSNGAMGTQSFSTGRTEALFVDVAGGIADPIRTDADGRAEFRCPARGVSIWVAN